MNPFRAYRNYRQYKETVRELRRLSAHELKDVGIAPGDIEMVARGGR